MRKHIIKKLLSLTILYAAIIIGIFIIQFKSDSIIRKTIHSMRVTLVSVENSNEQNHTNKINSQNGQNISQLGTNQIALKNQFHIAYNGIQFAADDSTPVKFEREEKINNAKLLSFEESNSSITLNFTNNIKITFAVAEELNSAPLMISAEFPETISQIVIPTKTLSGFSFTELKQRQAIIEGKNETYSLVAPSLQNTNLVLLQNSKFARYSQFIKQTEFSLNSIQDIAQASKVEWQTTINNLSSTIISEFMKQSQSDPTFIANLSEQTVISYVASMGLANRYTEALNSIPEFFVKGSKRTYLSAPYFGGLAKVTPELFNQIENYKNMVSLSLQNSSCDIFTMENIAEYIFINESDPNVKKLIELPTTLTDNNFTILQAAGILNVYSQLKENQSALAEILVPVLEPCVKKISDSCRLDNNKLLLSENDTNLSVISAIIVGDAFIHYGAITNSTLIENCGYLLVNSYLSDLSGIDLRTLCALYPVAVHNNPYYPHFAKIRVLDGKTIWAWTIAREISVTQDENRTIYIDVNFPLNLSHYVILNGIEPFRRIQIYNMDFRTDPQFEIYNSSGYVYRTSTKSLLLKSRHKAQHEIIKLFYRELEQEQPAVVAE